MELLNKTIGFAITGSFCTIDDILPQMQALVDAGATVLPILSYSTSGFDTRFGKAKDLKEVLTSITKQEPILTIAQAEPIGPKGLLDILLVAPTTGNTLAKIANAITDTPVTMAVKAHLRNDRPVVLSVSTNDGLGASAKNIGLLLNTRNIYFVPFGQDDPVKKSRSLVAKTHWIVPTLKEALEGRQIQPLLAGREDVPHES